MRGVAILAAVLLFSVGCDGRPPLDHGTVVGKHYHRAWVETRFHPVQTGKTTTMIPYTVDHPERWTMTIADEDGRSRELSVDQETYHRFNRGDWWASGERVAKGQAEQSP